MALSETAQRQDFTFRNLPRRVLAPVPLPLIQPLLQKIVRSAAQNRPEIFNRLGPHRRKTYLIDPVNMPFVLVLRPDAAAPSLRARRRRDNIPHDARIAGTFLTLLKMIDGRLDGDALFFTRELTVEGDTEAIVVLRNAMDDLDGHA
ncbi:MAG: SCP2 sterol-binding domain-containing protein, partial [Micavibrio aeruginosavorus]|nr:SCP2 sterol-binding domain-containing protein [Micavibrio aeruginosavorus]